MKVGRGSNPPDTSKTDLLIRYHYLSTDEETVMELVKGDCGSSRRFADDGFMKVWV